MKNSDLNQCCHESREEIPWLLNGTLSDSAAAAVTEHIQHCNVCQADFESHTQLRDAVLGSQVTPMVPTPKPEEIFGIVRAGSSSRRRSRQLRSGLIALAASIAVLAVATVLSFSFYRDGAESNQVFETATSEGLSGGIDYILQLQFEDGVTRLEKDEIVGQLDDVVKWTISDSGNYEVHVQLNAPSLAVLKDYEEDTTTISGVHSAKFTALQLPVR